MVPVILTGMGVKIEVMLRRNWVRRYSWPVTIKRWRKGSLHPSCNTPTPCNMVNARLHKQSKKVIILRQNTPPVRESGQVLQMGGGRGVGGRFLDV
jgi:acyl-CoA hydrolase